MRRVKGTYDGRSVRLRESVDLPRNTEVVVLIPESHERALPDVLGQPRRAVAGEMLSMEDIVALVHDVRSSGR